MTTRVAVLAPSPLVRAGLDTLLAESPGLVRVALPFDPGDDGGDVSPLERAAGSGADVVVWAPGSSLDVTAALGAGLVDLRSGVYGDAALSAAPALVVIADLAPRDAASAVRAGARAVLPNGVRAETLAAAVAAAAAGLVVFPADDAAGLLPADDRGDGPDPASAPGVAPLSGRERDVLALMAEGLANKQIAYRLGISEHTVKTHVAALFAKLHAGTRAEAVVTAARAGLLLL
ncbi:helix-turn-helix transcriptional regulator [Gemmatimonadetes bacterium T265]|nr:helix-turn-helix transcriptional regulator [Gemmatimonadetes bacterium T265]